MMETENLLQNINLSGLQGKDWPEYSRFNPEKTISQKPERSTPVKSISHSVSRLSNNSNTGYSKNISNIPNGSVSSTSGYETGSSSGYSEKDLGPSAYPYNESYKKKEQGQSHVARHSQPFLSVNGAVYPPNHRRRSASVNRYENPPDSPPPQKSSNFDGENIRRIRPSSSMANLRSHQDDWSISTTKRLYRFSQEGFDMARSAPIVHKPTLKIGIEGQREFTLSNNRDFPSYNIREISSARPGGRYRPSSVTTGRAVEGPLISRTENREHYTPSQSQEVRSGVSSKTGTVSPASTLSDMSGSGSLSISTGGTGVERSSSHSSRAMSGIISGSGSKSTDPRFAAGSTTRSTYRDVSAYNEEARPKSVRPVASLKLEGNFSRSVSSKEHFQPLPYCRTPATIRKSMIDVPTGKFDTTTTYRQNIDENLLYNGARRSSRFDYSLRIPDKIDWL